LVRNCVVYNTGQIDYGVGIMVANGTNNVTVEFNKVYNNGVGIMVGNSGSSWTGEPTNITVRYNLSYNNATGLLFSTGGTYWTNASAEAYGNVIFNNTAHAINLGLVAGTSQIKIYNNTVYVPSGFAMAIRIVLTGTGDILYLKNNVLYNATYYPIQFWSATGVKGDVESHVVHSNNLLYRGNSIYGWILNEDFSEYNKAQVTATWDATSQVTNPTFTGGTLPTGFSGTYGTNMVPNANYFSISSGDALNNGATLGSRYNGCINGAGLATPIIRPRGMAYDIGAYEYNNPPAVPTGVVVK
jgi:hypothetical protein